MILLERTPLVQKTPANPSTGRRCRTLHVGRGGDLFGRWMAAVTVGAMLVASCWGSMWFGGGLLFNEWEPTNAWFTHGFHLALWLVVGSVHRRAVPRVSRPANPSRGVGSRVALAGGRGAIEPGDRIHDRFKEVYWSKVPGKYLAGDNARCDDDGYYWIMGRIDDVLNVSGHRLSTIEIESALVSHPKVAEAAAVGRPDDLKGEAVAVFVTLREGEPNDELREELKKHVRHEIGALAQPDDIRFTGALPKPAAARSCAACCATSPPARNPSATQRRWRITASWPN